MLKLHYLFILVNLIGAGVAAVAQSKLLFVWAISWCFYSLIWIGVAIWRDYAIRKERM